MAASNPKRRSRKRIAYIFVVYIASSLVFALAYWLTWTANPDSFIPHPELNLSPIETLQNLYWDNTLPIGATPRLEDLTSLNEQTRKQIGEYRHQINLIQQLENKLQKAKKQDEAAQRDLMDGMAKNFNHYKEELLAPYRNAINDLTITIDTLEKHKEKEGDQLKKSNLEVNIANLRLEEAKIQAKVAQEELDAYNMFLSDLVRFQDPSKIQQFRMLNEILAQTEENLGKARSKQLEVKDHINDLLTTARAERVGRLNYIDFLYFSLGVSTSSTLGDMLPNSRVIRGVVILQLLFSIFLVGTLITGISDSLLQGQ